MNSNASPVRESGEAHAGFVVEDMAPMCSRLFEYRVVFWWPCGCVAVAC